MIPDRSSIRRYNPFAGLPPLWTAADDAAYLARLIAMGRLPARIASPTRLAASRLLHRYGRAAGAVCLALATVGGLGWTVLRGAGSIEAGTRTRDLICAETGEVALATPVPDGSRFPIDGTLYPAELCYWTPGGGVTLEPTRVLLNMYRGIDAPTLCPRCGREVVYDNPMPPIEMLIEASE